MPTNLLLRGKWDPELRAGDRGSLPATRTALPAARRVAPCAAASTPWCDRPYPLAHVAPPSGHARVDPAPVRPPVGRRRMSASQCLAAGRLQVRTTRLVYLEARPQVLLAVPRGRSAPATFASMTRRQTRRPPNAP